MLGGPVLYTEAATVAIRNDDTMILQNLKVKWTKGEDGKYLGEFQLNKEFCETRQIEIVHGDYACVKVHCITTFSDSLSSDKQLNGKGEFYKEMEREAKTGDERPVFSGRDNEGQKANVDALNENMETSAVKSHWVGHCVFITTREVASITSRCSGNEPARTKSGLERAAEIEPTPHAVDSTTKYTLKLFQNSMRVPKSLDKKRGWICTVEIIKQTITYR